MDEKKIHSINTEATELEVSVEGLIDKVMTALCPFIFRLMAVFLFRSSRGRTRRHSAT